MLKKLLEKVTTHNQVSSITIIAFNQAVSLPTFDIFV